MNESDYLNNHSIFFSSKHLNTNISIWDSKYITTNGTTPYSFLIADIAIGSLYSFWVNLDIALE